MTRQLATAVIRVLVKALKNNNALMVAACVSPVFACTSIPCVWFKKRRQEKKWDLVGQGDWHIQFAKLDAAPLLNPAGVMSNDAA